MSVPARLERRVGPGLLTAYGVGVMVGAGIYVLVGTVAAQVGVWAPLAFLVAGLVAAPSALSYAELSTRLPEAAGETAYVAEGLRLPWLAFMVGLGIVLAGTISAGAVLRGGAGYLTAALALPAAPVVIALGLALTAIAVAGVMQSMVLMAALTVIEVTGLVMVIGASVAAPVSPDWMAPGPLPWTGLGLAVTLAFFAFIGFEDMVNMAEEVRHPERSLPLAILAALAITTALYMAVSYAAVRAVPLAALGASEQPLALVWQRGTGQPGVVLAAIAAAAAINGVLAQIVMAARVLYGTGRRVPALAFFSVVHPRTHTPARATLAVGAAVIVAALALPVATLAGATSVILLAVFALVNLSLIALKRRAPTAPFTVPAAVPWAGLVLSLAALISTLGGLA